jgi:hypothetical protein
MFIILKYSVVVDGIWYCEDIWRVLAAPHGTVILLCAITASVAGFPSASGTAVKYPHCIRYLYRSRLDFILVLVFPLLIPKYKKHNS